MNLPLTYYGLIPAMAHIPFAMTAVRSSYEIDLISNSIMHAEAVDGEKSRYEWM